MRTCRVRRLHTAWMTALCLAVLGAAGAPAPARAQPRAAEDGDELDRLRRDVRRAQQAFERRRRALLPWSDGGGGRCDTRVGRYCYWYDEGLGPGPAEPPRVAGARRALLATLDSAARRLPDDEWLAGQRVRYWVEAGAADTALGVARQCTGEGWWCRALRGFAHHAGGDYTAAGGAFDSALAAMPADEACRWRAIHMLLEGEARARYEARPCPERAAIEERFWWLADPLLSVPGNDRRTEHFARHVLSRLHTDALSPYTTRWGPDLHELLLRYGWPARWSRREPASVGSVGTVPADVVGHEPVPSYRFSAGAPALDRPLGAETARWRLRDPAARERYTPPYARQLRALPAEVVAFRRGDSLLLAGVYRLRGDSVLRRLATAPAHVAVAAATRPGAPVVAAAATQGAAGGGTLLVPAAPTLAAIEVRDDSGHAARWRAAVVPPELVDGVGVSGLLLFEPRADRDTTLAAALASPVVEGRATARRPLGLYWELYGLPRGRQAVQATLVVRRERPGALARAWNRLRGSARTAPVHLQWTDVMLVRADATPRAMHVAVPALTEGAYRMELRLRVPDGRTLSVTHTLEIEGR